MYGWILVRDRKKTDGSLFEKEWRNEGAGYDTTPMILTVGPYSIGEFKSYLVYISVNGKTVGRQKVNNEKQAMQIAKDFMKRNKNLVKLK